MNQMLEKPKFTSLLLAVVALVVNLFQPNLTLTKGYSAPELTAQVSISADQDDQNKTSADPDLDYFIPAHLNKTDVIRQSVNNIPAQLPAQRVSNYQTIQARAPPLSFV